ncbi:MAG: c-type cytochrome [Planctomycetaceae bacterium]
MTLLVFVVTGPATADGQDDVFQSTIRPTDALTPADELKTLTVPEGFSVSLFASEPQIQKPLNMAFDAAGRLWVTMSTHYPFPAKAGEGHDSIRILEDTTGDGFADKVTVFADDLNIPIGVLPYGDGAIVFSIPDILFLRDTDGDGKADTRKKLYGPFDTTRDTHGMNNAFRRGFDGWIYACHGFNNQSTVAGTDGHAVTMISGNVYRFRPDGSRIEHFGYGQVNPFGMTIDANGDVFTSDCHTKPVTLVIRDGCYESFGRPHDGLGFVPAVMDHLHGSTAIDGLCQYQHTVFPEEYRDNMFLGNVMTCRVHRNTIVRNGSSVRMNEEPDFLIAADPWFRPVDIQIGPDGAMYVADFYNKIIGHYEVPLDHPGRDRDRGRIWRIAWTGTTDNSPAARALTQQPAAADLSQLIAMLSHRSNSIRQQAADQLVERIGTPAVPQLKQALSAVLPGADHTAVPQLLWTLSRLGAANAELLETAYQSGSQRSRIHVMRVCSETAADDRIFALIKRGLDDEDALVRRAAADAAGQHPSVLLLKAVINALATCPADDVFLRQGLRIALRNQLRDNGNAAWFTGEEQPASAVQLVVSVLPGLKTPAAGTLALSALHSGHVSDADKPTILQHAAGFAADESIPQLIAIARELPASEQDLQTTLWKSLADGFQSRQTEVPAEFREWSNQLADNILSGANPNEVQWGQYAFDNKTPVAWNFEQRQRPGSEQKSIFISSLPSGERPTGVLRSKAFVVPFSLKMYLCGHLGPPDKAPEPGNRVVLRDLESGAELASVLPPRSDIATEIEIPLAGHAGRVGYLEVIDGLDLGAYAWLAVSHISPRVVNTDEFDQGAFSRRLQSAVRILLDQQQSGVTLSETHVAMLGDITESISIDGDVRALAAKALLQHHNRSYSLDAADLLRFGSLPRSVDRLISEYASGSNEKLNSLPEADFLKYAFSEINQQLRQHLVRSLASKKHTAEMLVVLIESGVPSAEVLRDDRLAQQMNALSPEIAERVTALREKLPPASADTQQIADRIVTRLRLGEGDSEAGQALFKKHCSVCHKQANEGGVAGPQLDGIATRGAARLLEDLLTPNTNVDVAFRTSVIVLTDGRTLAGIVKPSQDGRQLTIIDVEGKAVTVGIDQVDERIDSNLSLMPANFNTILSEDDMVNLTSWLAK